MVSLALLFANGCAYDMPNATGGAQSNGDLTCIPGQTAFCACSTGSQGVQLCSASGAYSACDCSASVGGSGSSGSANSGSPGAPSADTTWTATCLSGRYWDSTSEGDEDEDDDDHKDSDGELEGSSLMTPGQDCITCHRQDEGPTYSVAGTVFEGYHDMNDCYGVSGAIVRIVDANGVTIDLSTNETGNFYRPASRGRIATPYTASVIYQGREVPMVGPQTDLNCATCHTVQGEQGASGRIIVP